MEDCSHYGRVHHPFTELMSRCNWRMNHANESNLAVFAPNSDTDQVFVEALEKDEYVTVLFTPSALGITNCGKLANRAGTAQP